MGIKVVDDMYKWIRKQCKGDDSLVFLVLLGLGFVLCMIFNREGFMNLPEASTDTNLGNAVESSENFTFGATVPNQYPGTDDQRLSNK